MVRPPPGVVSGASVPPITSASPRDNASPRPTPELLEPDTVTGLAQLVHGPRNDILQTDSECGDAGVPGFLDSHADGPVRMLVSRLPPGILTRTSD